MLASDAKIFEEDEETGAKRFKCVRMGGDHYSLAFTYAWMAGLSAGGPRITVIRETQQAAIAAGGLAAL